MSPEQRAVSIMTTITKSFWDSCPRYGFLSALCECAFGNACRRTKFSLDDGVSWNLIARGVWCSETVSEGSAVVSKSSRRA